MIRWEKQNSLLYDLEFHKFHTVKCPINHLGRNICFTNLLGPSCVGPFSVLLHTSWHDLPIHYLLMVVTINKLGTYGWNWNAYAIPLWMILLGWLCHGCVNVKPFWFCFGHFPSKYPLHTMVWYPSGRKKVFVQEKYASAISMCGSSWYSNHALSFSKVSARHWPSAKYMPNSQSHWNKKLDVCSKATTTNYVAIFNPASHFSKGGWSCCSLGDQSHMIQTWKEKIPKPTCLDLYLSCSNLTSCIQHFLDWSLLPTIFCE